MSDSTVNSPLLPQTRIIPFDSEMAKKDPVGYMQMLTNDLSKMYTELANAHNQGVEYSADGNQPTPAPGQLMVWKDLSSGQRWILYNDDGVVSKTELI